MARKQLDSLHIQNFRAFRDLDIPQLGHINLIVGMNNVGKTSLLEAVRLYANRGTLEAAWDILEERGEIEPELRRDQPTSRQEVEQRIEVLRYLFHDYPRYPMNRRSSKSKIEREAIRVNGGSNEDICVWLTYVTTKIPEPLRDQLALMTPVWRLEFANDVQHISSYPLERDLIGVGNPGIVPIPNQFVSVRNLDDGQMGRRWSNISLTDKKEEVVKALRLLDPRIQELDFLEGRKRRDRRIPFVRLSSGAITPIPLRSLGEGIVRILGLSLALVNAEHGVFLIDEIDSGFHYSVMEEMWSTVTHLADRFNVQVFATTHSDDCLRAFETIIPQKDSVEGIAISLRTKQNEPTTIVPVIIQEKDLKKVAEYGVEVR